MIKIYLMMFISVFSFVAVAHPVSFQGAWGVMSYNEEKDNELTVNYSFKSYIAGAASFYKVDAVEATIPHVNFLLKRWNNDDSQGNVYLIGGYGLEKYFNESKGIGLGQIDVDWESRKYYVAAQYAHFWRQSSDVILREDFKKAKARVGFAPYLAEYNDLNTWFILQMEQKNDEDVVTTQFVRFFYRNVLIELGASFGGGGALNFMAHF